MCKENKFDPERHPFFPRAAFRCAARNGKPTFFHIMAFLWKKAKAEYDTIGGKTDRPAKAKYEEYSAAVDKFYGLATKQLKGVNVSKDLEKLRPIFESSEAEYEAESRKRRAEAK